jgi:DNA-binding MarR family transcriptional regulator
MSRMVDGLEKRNLAVRVAKGSHKRHKLVYLTKLGRQRIEKLNPIAGELLETAFQGVARTQLTMTLETLQTIIKNTESS